MFKKAFYITLLAIILLLWFSLNIFAISLSCVNENLKIDTDKLSELDKAYVQRVIV